MSNITPQYGFKYSKLEYLVMNSLIDTNESENRVSVGYIDNYENYKQDNTMQIRVEIDVPIEGIRFQLAIDCAVEVKDLTEESYSNLLKDGIGQLSKPALAKTTTIVSQLYESATGIPYIFDFMRFADADID